MKVLLRSPATVRSKNNIKKFCERCLQSIAREKIKLHKSLCEHHQPQVIEIPKDGSTVKFENWQKIFKCPCVVYADLQALDVRTDSFESVEVLFENGLNDVVVLQVELSKISIPVVLALFSLTAETLRPAWKSFIEAKSVLQF